MDGSFIDEKGVEWTYTGGEVNEYVDGQWLEVDRLKVIIPECCREGWEDCPHVVNREKKPKRQNPGL